MTPAMRRFLVDLYGGTLHARWVDKRYKYPATWLPALTEAGYIREIGRDFFLGSLIQLTPAGLEYIGREPREAYYDRAG